MRRLWLIVAVLMAGGLVGAAEVPASDADARLVSALGVGKVQGRDVLVHVSLSVAGNADIAEQAEAALRERGARPFQQSDYVLLGPTWADDDQAGNPVVTQYYNGSGAPPGEFATEMELAQAAWTNVSASDFAFDYGGTSPRCGSLIQECPGAQVFDGFQDVGWNDLGRCSIARCTLAVTWFGDANGDGTMDDADVAFNTRVSPWQTGCNADFDFRTIAIHEFGHVAGLGHSKTSGAIMEAYYGGAQCTLHQDDIDGLVALYAADGGGGDPPPPAGDFSLSVDGYKVRGVQHADLTWSGAEGDSVDVYRDGDLIATTANDGSYTDNIGAKGGGSYTYKLCEAGTSTCSNEVTIVF